MVVTTEWRTKNLLKGCDDQKHGAHKKNKLKLERKPVTNFASIDLKANLNTKQNSVQIYKEYNEIKYSTNEKEKTDDNPNKRDTAWRIPNLKNIRRKSYKIASPRGKNIRANINTQVIKSKLLTLSNNISSYMFMNEPRNQDHPAALQTVEAICESEISCKWKLKQNKKKKLSTFNHARNYEYYGHAEIDQDELNATQFNKNNLHLEKHRFECESISTYTEIHQNKKEGLRNAKNEPDSKILVNWCKQSTFRGVISCDKMENRSIFRKKHILNWDCSSKYIPYNVSSVSDMQGKYIMNSCEESSFNNKCERGFDDFNLHKGDKNKDHILKNLRSTDKSVLSGSLNSGLKNVNTEEESFVSSNETFVENRKLEQGKQVIKPKITQIHCTVKIQKGREKNVVTHEVLTKDRSYKELFKCILPHIQQSYSSVEISLKQNKVDGIRHSTEFSQNYINKQRLQRDKDIHEEYTAFQKVNYEIRNDGSYIKPSSTTVKDNYLDCKGSEGIKNNLTSSISTLQQNARPVPEYQRGNKMKSIFHFAKTVFKGATESFDARKCMFCDKRGIFFALKPKEKRFLQQSQTNKSSNQTCSVKRKGLLAAFMKRKFFSRSDVNHLEGTCSKVQDTLELRKQNPQNYEESDYFNTCYCVQNLYQIEGNTNPGRRKKRAKRGRQDEDMCHNRNVKGYTVKNIKDCNTGKLACSASVLLFKSSKFKETEGKRVKFLGKASKTSSKKRKQTQAAKPLGTQTKSRKLKSPKPKKEQKPKKERPVFYEDQIKFLKPCLSQTRTDDGQQLSRFKKQRKGKGAVEKLIKKPKRKVRITSSCSICIEFSTMDKPKPATKHGATQTKGKKRLLPLCLCSRSKRTEILEKADKTTKGAKILEPKKTQRKPKKRILSSCICQKEISTQTKKAKRSLCTCSKYKNVKHECACRKVEIMQPVGTQTKPKKFKMRKIPEKEKSECSCKKPVVKAECTCKKPGIKTECTCKKPGIKTECTCKKPVKKSECSCKKPVVKAQCACKIQKKKAPIVHKCTCDKHQPEIQILKHGGTQAKYKKKEPKKPRRCVRPEPLFDDLPQPDNKGKIRLDSSCSLSVQFGKKAANTLERRATTLTSKGYLRKRRRDSRIVRVFSSCSISLEVPEMHRKEKPKKEKPKPEYKDKIVLKHGGAQTKKKPKPKPKPKCECKIQTKPKATCECAKTLSIQTKKQKLNKESKTQTKKQRRYYCSCKKHKPHKCFCLKTFDIQRKLGYTCFGKQREDSLVPKEEFSSTTRYGTSCSYSIELYKNERLIKDGKVTKSKGAKDKNRHRDMDRSKKSSAKNVKLSTKKQRKNKDLTVRYLYSITTFNDNYTLNKFISKSPNKHQDNIGHILTNNAMPDTNEINRNCQIESKQPYYKVKTARVPPIPYKDCGSDSIVKSDDDLQDQTSKLPLNNVDIINIRSHNKIKPGQSSHLKIDTSYITLKHCNNIARIPRKYPRYYHNKTKKKFTPKHDAHMSSSLQFNYSEQFRPLNSDYLKRGSYYTRDFKATDRADYDFHRKSRIDKAKGDEPYNKIPSKKRKREELKIKQSKPRVENLYYVFTKAFRNRGRINRSFDLHSLDHGAQVGNAETLNQYTRSKLKIGTAVRNCKSRTTINYGTLSIRNMFLKTVKTMKNIIKHKQRRDETIIIMPFIPGRYFKNISHTKLNLRHRIINKMRHGKFISPRKLTREKGVIFNHYDNLPGDSLRDFIIGKDYNVQVGLTALPQQEPKRSFSFYKKSLKDIWSGSNKSKERLINTSNTQNKIKFKRKPNNILSGFLNKLSKSKSKGVLANDKSIVMYTSSEDDLLYVLNKNVRRCKSVHK